MLWYQPILWVLNGFLIVLYTIGAHLPVLLVLPPAVWLYVRLPQAAGPAYKTSMRPWLIAAAGLAFLSAIAAPSPVPWLLALIAWVGAGVTRIDPYRPDEAAWNTIQGLALYALVGLGAALYGVMSANATGLAVIGQGYTNIIIAVALWIVPIGWLVLTVRNLFAHPPTQQPTDLYTSIRTRGKDK